MGVWITSRQHLVSEISIIFQVITSIGVEMILMPIIMTGIMKTFSLDNEAARAVVLIVCLSISMANFSLGSR